MHQGLSLHRCLMRTVLLGAPFPGHCYELVLQPLEQERVEVLLALCFIEGIVSPSFLQGKGVQFITC